MKKGRYKIVDKKRFTISILVISSLIVFIIFLFIYNIGFSSTYSTYYDNKPLYKKVLVREGDTLWQIAREYMPDNYDVRKMIYEIREFNYMDSADIYPGDIIKIPITYN